jgi:hypothetical protein
MIEEGTIDWRSGTLWKEQGIRKEIRGSSRASARSCSSISEGRAFTCGTVSVGSAALRRIVGWPEGARAKFRSKRSGRDETAPNPDVRIGATITDASNASEDASQSVKTRLLRSGMASRFSNVLIRGSLVGDRRESYRPDFSGWPGEAHSSALYTFSKCEGTPKFRTDNTRHPVSKIYSFAIDGSQETADGCSNFERGAVALRGAPGPPAEAFGRTHHKVGVFLNLRSPNRLPASLALPRLSFRQITPCRKACSARS